MRTANHSLERVENDDVDLDESDDTADDGCDLQSRRESSQRDEKCSGTRRGVIRICRDHSQLVDTMELNLLRSDEVLVREGIGWVSVTPHASAGYEM